MNTSSIDWREHAALDFDDEDLRPMSRQEFRAVLWMVTTAFAMYILVMALFVR